MNAHLVEINIAQVPVQFWKAELEKVCFKYHSIAAWVAIIFDPLFAITDYYNIPENWKTLFYIRIMVAVITALTVFLQRKFKFPSYIIAVVPVLLISLQNAITYKFIGNEHLLGHNLNYMALFIGASMFLAWEAEYSIMAILISAFASAIFLSMNPNIELNAFFVNGGLLLMAVGAFMFMLIKTRYGLTVKEIKARLALQLSNEEIYAKSEEILTQNEEIQAQAEKIKGINDNLELLVQQRTMDLETKNKALQEYAFINAHKLRSPVASILGLVNLAHKSEMDDDSKIIMTHLQQSARQLDTIVMTIKRTIEKADF